MKTEFKTRSAIQFAAAILLAAIIFMAISWLAGPTKMANSFAPPTVKMAPVTITSTRLPIEKMALIVIRASRLRSTMLASDRAHHMPRL